jgi:(+)-trans-carveol dehydrogenase
MSGRVSGKVAFVTGAGRGQGRSHAVKLAAEGADIIAIDVCSDIASVGYPLATSSDLSETVRQIEANGRRVVAVEADVRDYDAVSAAVERGVEEFGRLDIVSANAAIVSYDMADQLSGTKWNDVIDVNLTGAWHTCKAAIPHIVGGGRGGAIVLTSSAVGLRGCVNAAHYSSSKHGVVGLMRSLALELAPHSIRVNSVHPTLVDTEMIQNLELRQLFLPDVAAPTKEQFAAVAQAVNLLPVPWVECEDVSNALLFLVSDDARFITGATLPVDAGSVLK